MTWCVVAILGLIAILAHVNAQITLPRTGGTNTDPAMVADPRIDLGLFSSSSSTVRNMADIHDRFATYLFDRSAKLGCEPAALAAIIFVESGGRGFSGSRMIIRFENHVFKPRLNNNTVFDQHFKFDPDITFQGHEFRASINEAFAPFHGNQDKEWIVLQFAQGLNDLKALESASYGAPQIMGFNAQSIGYSNARDMFLAFSNSLENQMDGMIDFIKGRSNCLQGLRTNDFVLFATCYNGAGQAQTYGANILAARNAYVTVLNNLGIAQPTTCQVDGLFGTCGIANCAGEQYSGITGCSGSSNGLCCVAAIKCTPQGQPQGQCLEQSHCTSSGQLFSGLCPGGASIKCCVGGPTSSPVPAITPAPVPVSCSYEGLSGQCTTSCTGSNFAYSDAECTAGTKCCVPSQPCSPSAGTAGNCLDVSVCLGTTFSGLCPGSSAIRCCVPSKAPTASPTQLPTSKAPTKQPTSSTPTKAPTQQPTTKTPTKGPTLQPTTRAPTKQPTTAAPTVTQCTPDGGLNQGECKDLSQCNGDSAPLPGFCPGPTNIQCCVKTPLITRAPTKSPTLNPTSACSYEGLAGYCSGTATCTRQSRFIGYSSPSACGADGFCCVPAQSCNTNGTCVDTSRCPLGSSILSGLCPGSSRIKCCLASYQSIVSLAAQTNSEGISSSADEASTTSLAIGVAAPIVILGALATAFFIHRRRKSRYARELNLEDSVLAPGRWSVAVHRGQDGRPIEDLNGDNPLYQRTITV